MECKDLMIGDWVCWDGDDNYDCPMRVDGISTDDVSLEGEGFIGGYEGYIIPIPITEEILNANEFQLHEHEYTLRRRTSYDEYYHVDFFVTSDKVFVLDIECSDEDSKVTRVHKVINYVHELQHALRLCGLNELADNLKPKADE